MLLSEPIKAIKLNRMDTPGDFGKSDKRPSEFVCSTNANGQSEERDAEAACPSNHF